MIIIKVSFLSVVLFILRTAFAGLYQQLFNLPLPNIDSQGTLLLFNYGICLTFTIIISIIMLRTTLRGMKLGISIFLILSGIPIIINQIEAFFFSGAVNMSTKELLVYSFANICAAFIFSWVVVLFFKNITMNNDNTSYLLNRKQLLWRIPLLVVIVYPAIYLLFGSLLQMYLPAKAYYKSFQIPSIEIVALFQIFRGLLWMIPGILTFSYMKGDRINVAVISGLIFAIFMSAEILVPVDFMPLEVRYAHFIELSMSHFIWGIIMVLFLRKVR